MSLNVLSNGGTCSSWPTILDRAAAVSTAYTLVVGPQQVWKIPRASRAGFASEPISASVMADLAERRCTMEEARDELDDNLQLAYRDGLPIRAVILEGEKRDHLDSESESSAVEKRILDLVPWLLPVTTSQPATAW